MELSKQGYDSVAEMPIKAMYDYIKWKADLEEQKAKLVQESTNLATNKSRVNIKR